jgi:membrane protein DedA with SNARE-associated domain
MQGLIERWGLLAVFLGTLVEGEVVMILAGVVAHLGLIGLPAALVTGALGGFASDFAWFSAGRAGATWIRETRLFRQTEPVIAKVADRMGPWQVMFCRLVYGTRVPTMLLWGVRGLRPTRFAAFAFPGCVLWASIFGIAGFLLSGSAALIIGEVKRLQRWLLGAVAVAFVIIVGLKILARIQKRRAARTAAPARPAK